MNHNLTQAKRLVEAFIALMIGRKAQVQWGEKSSFDIEGVIHLPVPQTGDAAEIALLTRLAVHESGHLLETDSGYADRLTPEEATIFNVLEDPRMERRQVQRFPGASLVLSRGLDEMLQGIEGRLDEILEAMPERAVQLDMLMRGFLEVAPHGPIGRHAPRILDRLAPRITDAQRAAIDEAVARLPALATSVEAEDVARAFLARLREEEAPPLPEEAPDPQEQQDPSDPDQEPDEAEAEQGAQPGQDESEQCDSDAQPPESNELGGGTGSDSTPDEKNEANGANDGAPSANDGSAAPESGGSDAANQGSEDGGAPGPHGDDGAQGQASGANSGSGSDGDTGAGDGSDSKTEDSAGQQSDGRDAGSSGAASPSSAQPGNDPGTPPTEGEPFDLGQLLREAHVARYGRPEADHGAASADQAAAALSDGELQRVAALLAQVDPSAPLEELVQASLLALAASAGNEDGEDLNDSPGSGAGMALAVPTSPASVAEARLQGVQSRLVTVLQRELQDKRRRPTRTAYGGGRVMTSRFWRLGGLGDTKVFVQKRPAGGIEAAATVLLDSSDSMRLRLPEAAEVTMAFSLALQRLGVRTRVVRFPGIDTVTETIQRFGEPARSCVHRCAELAASGGTPIGAAVALETPALLEQRKLKKVLVVVTDDEPGDPWVLEAALERAAELDILVVGVGIGCDISSSIPNSVAVEDVNELPDALARLFRDNITEKLAA